MQNPTFRNSCVSILAVIFYLRPMMSTVSSTADDTRKKQASFLCLSARPVWMTISLYIKTE